MSLSEHKTHYINDNKLTLCNKPLSHTHPHPHTQSVGLLEQIGFKR